MKKLGLAVTFLTTTAKVLVLCLEPRRRSSQSTAVRNRGATSGPTRITFKGQAQVACTIYVILDVVVAGRTAGTGGDPALAPVLTDGVRGLGKSCKLCHGVVTPLITGEG